MVIETIPFDAAEFLDTPESQVELLAEAVESGDARFIAAALGTIARARGMTAVAREAGVTREALYRALSEDGDPRLTTLLGVARALDLALTFTPKTADVQPSLFPGKALVGHGSKAEAARAAKSKAKRIAEAEKPTARKATGQFVAEAARKPARTKGKSSRSGHRT